MPGYKNVMMLEGAQAGGESTRGTVVTPTRILYPSSGGVTVTYNQEADDYSESTRSYFGKKTHALGLYSVDLAVEERVSYEDLCWWLNFALKGGETTPDTVLTTGKQYVFTPSDGSDTLEFMTLVAGHTDNYYTFGGCAVNELQLRFDPSAEATWMLSASLMGNSMAASASWTALSERARTMVLARGTKLYVDDSSAIGTTQLTGTVRSGQLTIANNFERKAFLENSATYATDMGRGEQMVTGEFTFEFANDAQFAKMRSGTVRKIRIVQEGEVIGAGTAKYQLQIDLPNAYYNAPSIGFAGQNKTITFGVVGYVSATTAHPIEVKVTTAETSVTL